jgi:hypothetical protein
MGCTLSGECHMWGIRKEENQSLECGWCDHCIGMNIVTLSWQRPLWEGD